MTWVKLDDGFANHPKVVAAGDEAAWLYIAGLCYASAQLTDGQIPKPIIARLTGLRRPDLLAARLVDVGLWHNHTDHYTIHDYADHQRPRADVQRAREAGRDRAKRSRERKANEHRNTSERSRTVRAIEAETETETETDVFNGGSSTRSRLPDGWTPPPNLVEQLITEGWSRAFQSAEAPKFAANARDRGKQSEDWPAAYEIWIRRSQPDHAPANADWHCRTCNRPEPDCGCGYDAEYGLVIETHLR